jgi:hypothetical protein
MDKAVVTELEQRLRDQLACMIEEVLDAVVAVAESPVHGAGLFFVPRVRYGSATILRR